MIEEQFMANPLLHDPNAMGRKAKDLKAAKGEDGEEDAEGAGSGDHEQFSNQRLLTPRMKKLMQNKDAREVLQEEINESVLRLKQAKFGHSLAEIVPDHQNKFYLPDKSHYMPKDKKNQGSASNANFNS